MAMFSKERSAIMETPRIVSDLDATVNHSELEYPIARLFEMPGRPEVCLWFFVCLASSS